MSDDRAAPGYRRFDCTVDDPEALDRAAEAARVAVERGECIVLPTDTVYGIGADAFSPLAVQALLAAKHRGRDMPPPVLISDGSLIRALATEVPPTARELVVRHWPGPLTVIVVAQPSLRMDLGEAEGTIALRVPDHDLARDILRRTGPMAVSSANISGHPAATNCDEAVDQLGDSVAVYLDGGPVPGPGAPSTIVDFSRSPEGEVLRRGALSIEVLRQTCPNLVDLSGAEPTATTPVPPPPTSPEPTHPGPEPTYPGPEPTYPSPEPVEGRSNARPAAPPGPGDQHEPTTDELGITHSLADPDQPSLFEGQRDAEESEQAPRSGPGD